MFNPNLFFFNVLGQTLIGLTKVSRNFGFCAPAIAKNTLSLQLNSRQNTSRIPPSLFLDSFQEREHEIFMIHPTHFCPNIFFKSFFEAYFAMFKF